MKKKKKLSELKLTSFVTSFNENEETTVQGGAGTSAKGGCLTVITYGYWTYCCGDSGWEC